MPPTPHYLTDPDGQNVGVVLDLAQYESLLDARRKLDALRLFGPPEYLDDDFPFSEQALIELQG